jgi:hypothetical protein
VNARHAWALVAAAAALGAAGGLALGLLLHRATYPHLVLPSRAAAWGLGTGATAGLLAVLVLRLPRPPRSDVAACALAFAAGVVGVAGVMAAGALTWRSLFDSGILETFSAGAVLNPRRHAMALAAWRLRYAAGAFGILLCAWMLCRGSVSSRWRMTLAAMGFGAFAGALAAVAAPAYRAYGPVSHSNSTDPASVLRLMRKVAHWQLEHPRHRPTDWHNCPWHAGLLALHQASGDARYREHLLRTGEALGWQLGPQPRLADDQCIGSVYLDLYRDANDPRMIQATQKRFDALMAEPRPGREEWSWCDALFMAPPVLARLAAVTGRREYIEFMDLLFWDAVQHLYDPKARLFHRDDMARKQTEADGRPRFWGRGNAWVLAGLARTLPLLPADHPSRSRYVALFRDMAETVIRAQQPDGFWRSSLLDPQAHRR